MFVINSYNRWMGAGMDAMGLAALAASIVGAFYYYRRIRPDRFMVTIAVATGLAWMAVAIGRVVFSDLHLENMGFVVMALVVLGEIALGLRWSRGSSPPRASWTCASRCPR